MNQTEECNPQTCPLWAKWLEWASCSETCGQNGTQTRIRECKNGILGGDNCSSGDEVDTEPCNRINCPSFQPWTEWSECVVTCGGDFQD